MALIRLSDGDRSTLSVVSSIGAISWLITPRRIRLSESFEDIGTASRFSSWHSLSRSTASKKANRPFRDVQQDQTIRDLAPGPTIAANTEVARVGTKAETS
jgi:hypothetical protein